MPHQDRPISRSQLEHNNARADSAAGALLPYANWRDSDTEECITDLLCDLHHLCAREGLQFERLNARASLHFRVESELR
jgi:hypothetical protein